VPAVRRAGPDDLDACVEIVRRLSDFFTPDVPDKVRADWPNGSTWVVDDDGPVVGFALVGRRFAGAAEILWIAVEPERRGGGIGTLLLETVATALAADGVVLLEAKTLDSSEDYEPYVATRAFWEARGFLQIDMINPFPEWGPGNPAAIYVRPLADPPGESGPSSSQQ
jgi:ribosomal protein S18 acetylase RimI-like enzyme